ncbi:MAG: Protein archease [Candidatus Wolfebacteria bacterium GW2011_GWE1_48_7]|uniref:Protein archease n=2 Tax=Candidatus Wolfeibacteriota TaxID=1752735 RepID=A0A0G1U6D2_9BACT|nr:MAG: hypothetical protein UX70_C0001G0316 [Candidatus Wolfebacteria bacterium GW2011_GWB1_47_1]KKU34570.1 MAG: Protein archease [Candidatus Wolfebacteria bacterium GW2011_GWC2_46_275]KKU41892.1 MAG: Protein archease [Candidatus Wolfebacteria bacterium GW2011_GWB2_46_69]KKU54170.1 MAG: Protein archease [Candidatus Wolfebacteria bacterium GW2011_GWC1_47_103]KKU59093.1 MAG: Protein archease [Candidatus Wolfebacteria bacterium GW2011_GWE2_47_12]KKU65667.1 MAG: Protein archease [Candidatus Wolfe
MKKYTVMGHPAELRIQVLGDTIEHVFMNAADAMADIMARDRYASVSSTERVSTKSVDRDAALVDFLNELLAQSHVERSVHIPESVVITEENKTVKVEAIMRRYLVRAFDEDIKAVTHQDVRIEHREGKWRTTLVFDI